VQGTNIDRMHKQESQKKRSSNKKRTLQLPDF